MNKRVGDHILGIDVIRFAAAAAVMVFHLGFSDRALLLTVASPLGTAAPHPITQLFFTSAPTFPVLAPFTWFAWVGVEIFFVISGFVIANSAQGVISDTFARRRIVRLMPAVWICSTLTFVVLALSFPHSLPALMRIYARSLILFPRQPWIDGVYWTLCVEFGFYALIFLLLLINQFKRIELIMSVIGIVGTIFLLAAILTGHGMRMEKSFTLDVLLFRHGCLFAAGVLLWLITERGLTPARIGVLAICLVGGLAEIVLTSHEKNIAGAFTGNPVVPSVVWLLGVAAIWASVQFNGQAHQVFGRWSIAIRRMGLMTYPLYLLHAEIGFAILNTFSALTPAIDLLVAISLVLALAWVTSRYAEPWLQSRLNTPLKRLSDMLSGAIDAQRTPAN
jgi:peptidoglycan/LPS O-acetylase OafA/YrhL